MHAFSVYFILSLHFLLSSSFLTPTLNGHFARSPTASAAGANTWQQQSSSSTALNVWWFGGTQTEEQVQQDSDSCELVAVRIEKTSPNSRRIYGEIVAPVPLMDVWAILTDYNRLSTHVPNLVESKIAGRTSGGQQGDGSYQCRLFQRGAQKIVGFEFGASLTMDMQEHMLPVPPSVTTSAGEKSDAAIQDANGISFPNNERRITFKCVDSMFFSGFDGEWKVQERVGDDGQVESLISYVVDVRPKGPVPVTALEWRIREDVPTNLRAVKRSAMEVGYKGVMLARYNGKRGAPANGARAEHYRNGPNYARGLLRNIKWDRDETMAAYLTD